MKIKKVRKLVYCLAILSTIFLPSFSISAFADAHDDALAEMELDYYSTANNVWLHPESGINNSTAYNTSGNILQFSGNGNLTGNNNTYDNFDIAVDGDLSIDSGANVTNLTVNQTIGNSTEMAVVMSHLLYIKNFTYGIMQSLTVPVRSQTDTHQMTDSTAGASVTIFLTQYSNGYFVFNGSSLNYVTNPYYGTIPAILSDIGVNLATSLHALGLYLGYIFSDSQTYEYWTLTPSQNSNGETFVKTTVSQSGTWHSVILNRLNYISDLIGFFFDRFFQWYYPLDINDPTYWRYWNSDNQTQENTNLAGVLYNITWYLGNLYILESASAALDGMEDAVEDVTTTFNNIEAQEEAVISSVSSHIEAFNPSTSDFGALRALPWMSQYLQYIYTSLGAYGTVITIGLLLGVCLQIIGYARYK